MNTVPQSNLRKWRAYKDKVYHALLRNRDAFLRTNYDPVLPLAQRKEIIIRWLSLEDQISDRHISGKIAVVGHTPQDDVLRLPHLIGLDTGCGFGKKLTAMEVQKGEIWQTAE